ncbi:PucR family transcriptional regulator ligand-binding domain-containing protein [Streptomyces longispororuber]|uniref:PucR family transcriptional regulator ligand-binding domain-containing protein n=1 Tax=Streptomyces longispororuber TaxID=68230 RepID=UPI00210A1879|nr:PucR family transcriptional regulator ligand-binding domain-containing protein [Streptomyces longispororuber]MCQ4206456.1 PucR family transcriptional regulator ligand-binding domain-containing protein [Streptomyces longispororuber]
MPATVADVLHLPHLRLALFAGTTGLGRAVTWAHASDLDSPWNWVAGGELLMRNGRTLPRAGSAQAALVHSCADAGASGILIGEDPQTPPLHREFAGAADERALSVLTTPYAVSFAAIARAVADANAGESSARVGQVERIYGALRDALGSRNGDSPTARLARDLRCRLLLLDTASAHPVDPAAAEPDPALRQALLTEVGSHDGRIPGVLHLSLPGRTTAIAVEVPAEEPTVLVAVNLPGKDTSLLHHLATAAAVETAHQAMIREHERRVGAELLAQLLDARLDRDAAARELTSAGLDPSRSVVVAARHDDTPGQRDLHLALGRRRIPHLLSKDGGLLFALIHDAPLLLPTLRQKLGAHSALGFSALVDASDRIPIARHEAVWALSVAHRTPGLIARYDESAPYQLLRTPEEARAVVDRVLGPLLAYDADHGTELTASLHAFLRHRRSWQRTAAALNVHKQTVMYRMQRVEQLTARTIAETGDLTDLWIAFQAQALLSGWAPDTYDAG